LFRIPWEAGELTAVSLDEAGHETGSCTLRSASFQTQLRVLPEEPSVKAGGLSFVRLRYTDEQGVWKPLERHMLKVEVENGTLLGLGCANSYVRGNYTTDTTDTYYGEALAVVRAGAQGEVKVTATETDSVLQSEAVIPII
jgi:beta-galactosidase